MAYKRISPIPIEEGGTASITLTDHAVLIGAGTSAITAVGPVSSTGAFLSSNGVGSDPGFSTATYPLTTTANQILYSSATNTVSEITTSANGVLITNASSVPSLLAAGTTGQVLTATTGAPPSWAAAAGGGVSGPGSSTDRAIATWDGTGGTDLFDNSSIKISSAGEMTNSAQPAFLGFLSATDANVTGNGTTYNLGSGNAFSIYINQGSDFTTACVYTAPIGGSYFIEMQARLDSASGASDWINNIVTSNRSYGYRCTPASAVGLIVPLVTLADMDAADTVTFDVKLSGLGGDTADLIGGTGGNTRVSGALIC